MFTSLWHSVNRTFFLKLGIQIVKFVMEHVIDIRCSNKLDVSKSYESYKVEFSEEIVGLLTYGCTIETN